MPSGSIANASSITATVQSTGKTTVASQSDLNSRSATVQSTNRTTVVSQTFSATPNVSFDSLTDFDQTGVQDGFYIQYDSPNDRYITKQIGDANGSFTQANLAFDKANAAFNAANTSADGTPTAIAAFNKANNNSVNITSNQVFSNNAFHQANAAFNAANNAVSDAIALSIAMS